MNSMKLTPDNESPAILGKTGTKPEELGERSAEEVSAQAAQLDDDSGEITIVSEKEVPLPADVQQRLAAAKLRREQGNIRDDLGTPFGASQVRQ